MLSVIIPARNEIYLQKTIESVLSAARGDIEVIAILDGYTPNPQIDTNDDRVTFLQYDRPIGQRAAINEGVKRSHGKFMMKLDAHCSVDEGFDVKLAADCEYEWTMIPRMYNLDINTWQPKLHKRTDYMYISCEDGKLLRAAYYNRGQLKNDLLIDDTMCCMGPGWFMHKDRFLELGGCDENHGGWGQQGVEVALKAWLSGGALKVNKKTWFAHWFRGSGPGFPYKISGNSIEKARKYSRDLWLNNKWPQQKQTFQWLVSKFSPPGWEEMMEELFGKNVQDEVSDFNKRLYKHIHRIQKNEPKWRGINVVKFPTDLLLYEQAIWENKPDFIIETGTHLGGSTLFFADMLEMTGNGKVITIDTVDKERPQHPRVKYVSGSSTDDEIVNMIRDMVGGRACMVVLDSNHHRRHVKWELNKYSKIVTKGQFIVVEDIHNVHPYEKGPGPAVDWFLSVSKDFRREDITKQFLVSMTRDGWLRRR